MIFRSVVGKLWSTIALLILVSFITLGFFLSQLMESFYLNLRANELVHTSKQLALEIGERENPFEILERIDLISNLVNANILILDRRGLVQASSGPLSLRPGLPFDHPDLERVTRGDTIVRKGTHPRFDTSMMSVAAPIYFNQQVVGGVFIDAPLAQMTKNIERITQIIFYVAAATTGVAAIVAYFLSKSISSPLIQMNNIALAMAKGNYGQKINVFSRDEIGTLGNSLNNLSAELEVHINALQAEKTQLANILMSMTEGVISFDSRGRIVTLNPTAESLLSLTADNISPGDTLPKGGYTEKIKLLLEKAIAHEKFFAGEISINENIFMVKVAPIKDTEEIIGAVVVINDITKEKRLDKLRTDFVANISHELRTPLSFLQGYVEAILDGLAQTEAEREEYLQIILEETLRLRRLVNELLDLTQMESGQITLNSEPVDLGVLLKTIKRKFEPAANELNIALTLELPTEPPVVHVDQDRIEQALINLLDNAFRYTRGGQVTIKAESLSNNKTQIQIRDNGKGIAVDQLPYVFDRFYKVDKARTRSDQGIGGTGLGLSIVKNIINAHGEEISVNSQLGKGTIFTFSVPNWKPGQEQ